MPCRQGRAAVVVVGLALCVLPRSVTGSYGTCACYKDNANGTSVDCGCYNVDHSGESACAASCLNCVCLKDEPDATGIRRIQPCECNSYRYELDCFPASATLQLKNGTRIRMEELRVGHSIQAGPGGKHDDVHVFTHRQESTVAMFTAIHHSHPQSPLLMTAGHYLYVNGALKTARQVKVGDTLTTAAGTVTTVTKVDPAVQARGLYNPHTLTNDLVVNGIVVSALTDAVMPSLAHAFLWPARVLYNMGFDVVGSAFNDGAFHSLAPYIPGGEQDYSAGVGTTQ